MYVVKRSGKHEKVHFDKITGRISRLCYGLDSKFVDPVIVSQKVCLGVYKGVTTTELDILAAETAATLTSKHYQYGVLGGRLLVSNLHKTTKKSFVETMEDLHAYVEPRSGLPASLIDSKIMEIIHKHADALEACIVYDRDLDYDFFGFRTLERSYLLKMNGVIVERPQHMIMRVALQIHGDDIDSVVESYNFMSKRYFTHASPTLFNSATVQPQLSSCFLLTMKGDSIEGIYDTLKDCALISKQAGGVGLCISNIRASGSYIRGTNGTSNGLVPMLRVFNNTARYVDQGGGKRKGAFAVYIEPWHLDILAFLDLRKNTGIEEERCRDLYTGLWIPDLFMKRVEQDSQWSLFCPNEAPGLVDCWGEEFETLYVKYETSGKAREQIPARKVWQAILESQVETGTPYMLYKDHCNRKSNQQNLGTIHCSNLCAEIVEYSSKEEIAVCNLASVALPMFVSDDGKTFDMQKLYEITYHVTGNMNKVIDVSDYPVPETRVSNLKHRPIAIGVQGLADVFLLMNMAFDSPGAADLNKKIFECMYFASLTASKDLAKKYGPYESYKGSPISQGKLQFDLWGKSDFYTDERWAWSKLRKEIAIHGVRNSLLLAIMPTASTSQILGNNECCEPLTSNLSVRRTLAGEFIVVSKHLQDDFIALGKWDESMRQRLIASDGSIQSFMDLPQSMRDKHKTAYEIKQRVLIDMAADRGECICQSQSMNVFFPVVDFDKLTSLHFHAWRRKLKTGMYYHRSGSASSAIKVTVDPKLEKDVKNEMETHNNTLQEMKTSNDRNSIKEMNNNKDASPDQSLSNEMKETTKNLQLYDSNVHTHENEVLLTKHEQALICSLRNKEACTTCSS